MGKQRRRKRQSKGGGGGAAKNTTKQEETAAPSSSTLLQRIRHSDPRTRHAALAAVANTLLDPSSPKKVSKSVTPSLLQAIRERVLDSDLDVCQVAAGCLANYVTIVSSTISTQDSSQTMTAGWTLVLMGRLQQCYEHVTSLQQQQANNNNTNKGLIKQQKQWLALAVQCLKTLCMLTETNPEAVGRLTSRLDATPRHDFHQILLQWMQHSHTALTSANTVAAARNTAEDAFQSYHEQILTLAARTLHSAWDDNEDLLFPWKQECPDAFGRALELLETIIRSTGNKTPVVAQLHCAGAVLTARPVLMVSNQQTTSSSITQQTVVPFLLQQSQFSWTTAQSILTAYQQACEAWEKEQEDDALEREIIRKVEDRKEPARVIARRQKAQKEQQQQAAAAMMEDDNNDTTKPPPSMQDDTAKADTEDSMEDDKHNAEMEKQVETREALEKAREAWNQFLLPLQLSLELLTNLTSSNILMTGDDEEEDDTMMTDEDEWGDDQEAKFIQKEEQRQLQTSLPNSNAIAAEADQKMLLESALPQQLRQLFRQLYHHQVPQTQPMIFPEKSLADLEELQSKVMACLGNCWENISGWSMELTWPELQQAATVATGQGKEGLVSAMVIALKTFPSLRKQWQPEHVEFWLNELNNSNSSVDSADASSTKSNSDAVCRDIIGMLGILCSQEPHPSEVNQKICSALLAAMNSSGSQSSSLMIPCEVLNVLMDMYGNDEDDGCCHVSVFESMQVLGHFQRSVPVLKSKLKQLEKNRNSDNAIDRADLEQWKETVLNAARFVHYKKG